MPWENDSRSSWASADSYFAQGDTCVARGPRSTCQLFYGIRNINRVWSAGIDAKLAKRAGIRLSGNFDRSSGVGAITGEPPAYGPLTWPLVTGTVYYDVPKAGRDAVDLPAPPTTVKSIVTVNNFSAN